MKQLALILGVLLGVGCQDGTGAKAGAVAKPPAEVAMPPAGMRLVPELALFAQCLAASMKSPPGTQGTNSWQLFGKAEVDGKQYGWIMVEPGAIAEPLAAQLHMQFSVKMGAVNQGDNISEALCPREVLNEAVARTFLTMVIQVGGTDDKGQFLIYGGPMGYEYPSGQLPKRVANVSRAEARKAAVSLAAQALGSKPKRVGALWAQWADALQ
jgi:hypothetical protein